MTLQVIKAEDVRDGEPRWWFVAQIDAETSMAHNAKCTKCTPDMLHTADRRAFKREHGWWPRFAIVDRPAPSTDQPPPVLDFDELDRAIWSVEHAAEVRSGVTRSCNALRAALRPVIAEARAAVALRQELAALRAHFDAAAPEHNLPALLDLYNDRTTEAREKLAEAKRLGLEACDAALRAALEAL